MEFQSRFITVGGVKTHYLEAGTGEPLLLVHGGGAGADAWGNWKDCMPLYAADYRVIAVDMVGFGKSEKPDPSRYAYTQPSRNEHLSTFIEALELAPLNIIGNSMGGGTALGVAMSRPGLLRKMVLMGSAGLPIFNPDPAVLRSLNYDFTLEGMRALVRNLTAPGYSIDEELLRYRYELTLGHEKVVTAINASKMYYTEEEVAAVKTRTLVVGGKEDKIAVPARTRRYLELLENSWGFILPRCGHWVMMESTREFVALTRAFFRSDLFVDAA